MEKWHQYILLFFLIGVPLLQFLGRQLGKLLTAAKQRAQSMERPEVFDPNRDIDLIEPEEVVVDRREEFFDEPRRDVDPFGEPQARADTPSREPARRPRAFSVFEDVTNAIRELAEASQATPAAPVPVSEPEVTARRRRPSAPKPSQGYEVQAAAAAPHTKRQLSKDSVLYPPQSTREFARLFVWSEILRPPVALRETDDF